MPGGGYRYYRDPRLGPEYEAAMDALFAAYAEALPRVSAWAEETFPRAEGEPEAARRRAVNAKALDLLRGLLPAASLSHMGIYATGQAYEQLILHLIGDPLPEARAYGQMILDAIKAVMPSFVSRVERPDRGGEWVAYLERRREATERWAARLGLDRREAAAEDRPSVRLLHVRRRRGAPARRAAVRGRGGRRGGDAGGRPRARLGRARPRARRPRGRAPQPPPPPRAAGSRRCATGSRSCPTTAPSATCSATACSPSSGRRCPPTSAPTCPRRSPPPAAATSTPARSSARAPSTSGSPPRGSPEAAPYALCLGYRMRYVLDMNAREAMHLIELRSGREGHPGYRAVAHELHAQIASRHPAVAAAMDYVDRSSEPRLERILSEMRPARSPGRASALTRERQLRWVRRAGSRPRAAVPGATAHLRPSRAGKGADADRRAADPAPLNAAVDVRRAHRGRGGSAQNARSRPAGPSPCASARRSARRCAAVGGSGAGP